MSVKYVPVSCQLYDKLEELAVKKVKTKITYLDYYDEIVIEDFIVDFRTKNKEEFAILSSGLIIRLDKIIEII
jgi:transcriptional antiterminator Rof (Rho-off)